MISIIESNLPTRSHVAQALVTCLLSGNIRPCQIQYNAITLAACCHYLMLVAVVLQMLRPAAMLQVVDALTGCYATRYR